MRFSFRAENQASDETSNGDAGRKTQIFSYSKMYPASRLM